MWVKGSFVPKSADEIVGAGLASTAEGSVPMVPLTGAEKAERLSNTKMADSTAPSSKRASTGLNLAPHPQKTQKNVQGQRDFIRKNFTEQ